MAELLIQVVDHSNPDNPYLDARLTKRGDVIYVAPDGWPWGDEETSQELFRIVKVPDAAVSDLEGLTMKEPGDLYRRRTLQPRLFKLDLDALPQAVKTKLGKARKKRGARAKDDLLDDLDGLTVTKAQVNAIKVQKSSIPDPNIIG